MGLLPSQLVWDDTIAALASPAGPGWRGIIRISGPATVTVLETLFHAKDDAWRRSKLPGRYTGCFAWEPCRVRIPAELQLWPQTRSYTGQPVAELHVLGSPPLMEELLAELFRRGARLALPGEFTLRAFLAGKIDLLQAEAVLGVIDAQNDHELRIALRQLAGGISQPLATLRNELLDLLADLEAGLDFVEEHLEFVTRHEIVARLAAARRTLEDLRDQAEQRGTHADCPRVVLAGLPNAGKSTLFNALVGRTQALVSPEAGTTRDYVTARLQWDDLTLELVDTAGFEDASDFIEQGAQTLARREWQTADLLLWCSPVNLSLSERADDDQGYTLAVQQARQVMRVSTKVDLRISDCEGLPVCALQGHGLERLRFQVVSALSRDQTSGKSWVGATVARCSESLEVAASALARAEEVATATADLGDELLALELREALHHLGEIVGAVYTNDLLDRIFSRFCIGK